jgi:hypothetical protein
VSLSMQIFFTDLVDLLFSVGVMGNDANIQTFGQRRQLC